MKYYVRLDYRTHCNQSESGSHLIFSSHFLKVRQKNVNKKSVKVVKKKSVKAVSRSAVHAPTRQPRGPSSQISSIEEKATRSLDVCPINLEGRRPSWTGGLGAERPSEEKVWTFFRLSKQCQGMIMCFGASPNQSGLEK